MTDYSALAAAAEKAHREANERYAEAFRDSEIAAFNELVFTAAAAGVATVVLEPSDQGDHMTIDSYVENDPLDGEEKDLFDSLYEGAMDLQDSISGTWAILPGVSWDDRGYRATIDITVAAPAARDALAQED